jgi:glycosyltransferase involved in cell wall biosynthesis
MSGGVEEAAVLQESGSPGRAVRVAPRGAAEVTVVVPTRDERENVLPLTERLRAVDRETPLDVLFVDDSDDDTPAVIRGLAGRSALHVGVIHRAPNRRDGGLSGAVLAGIRAARTEWICVMDADLQHPPELLRPLLEEAHRAKADVVVASRYCTGGEVGDFTPARAALSRFSMVVAKALFPSRLRAVSDPLSGFFLIRRGAVDPAELRPRGFKILLELLVRGSPLTTSEVPFRFGERYAGESKASLREGLRYLRALIELRAGVGRNRAGTRRWEPPSAVSTDPPPRFRHERPAVWNRNGTSGREDAPQRSVLT